VSQTANGSSDPIKQLRKEMGFWDVLFFNIATVLGPRWIAAAAHNGTPSISLWLLAAVFFFVPSAMVINELSSRFPEEGGLYVWAKEAFGDFHGFVAGWTYWIYTIFYFPGLLLASAAMSGYLAGSGGAALAQDRTFLLAGSFVLLFVAVVLNIIGLNVGKWLQNAGGVSTYIPLLVLVGIATVLWLQHGSVTHFTWTNMMPHWSWDTVNFWSQIAFAFTGLELVSAMSAEIKDPRRTLPRAVLTSGVMIAAIYILGTFAVLSMIPASGVDPKSGVFHARLDGIADWIRWRDGRASGFGGQCGRSRKHGRGNRTRPVCCGNRPLLAGHVWKNSSAVENAVRLNHRASAGVWSGSAYQPNQ